VQEKASLVGGIDLAEAPDDGIEREVEHPGATRDAVHAGGPDEPEDVVAAVLSERSIIGSMRP
jgi:hypothetical protein